MWGFRGVVFRRSRRVKQNGVSVGSAFFWIHPTRRHEGEMGRCFSNTDGHLQTRGFITRRPTFIHLRREFIAWRPNSGGGNQEGVGLRFSAFCTRRSLAFESSAVEASPLPNGSVGTKGLGIRNRREFAVGGGKIVYNVRLRTRRSEVRSRRSDNPCLFPARQHAQRSAFA